MNTWYKDHASITMLIFIVNDSIVYRGKSHSAIKKLSKKYKGKDASVMIQYSTFAAFIEVSAKKYNMLSKIRKFYTEESYSIYVEDEADLDDSDYEEGWYKTYTGDVELNNPIEIIKYLFYYEERLKAGSLLSLIDWNLQGAFSMSDIDLIMEDGSKKTYAPSKFYIKYSGSW